MHRFGTLDLGYIYYECISLRFFIVLILIFLQDFVLMGFRRIHCRPTCRPVLLTASHARALGSLSEFAPISSIEPVFLFFPSLRKKKRKGFLCGCVRVEVLLAPLRPPPSSGLCTGFLLAFARVCCLVGRPLLAHPMIRRSCFRLSSRRGQGAGHLHVNCTDDHFGCPSPHVVSCVGLA